MEKKYKVWCSYENNWTCKEYSTIWMTYTCGPDVIRKRVRIMHSYFNGLWVFSRDVWGFLRERVGEELDKKGAMSKKELNNLIRKTNHFNSETWDEDMSHFVWHWEYMDGNFEKLDEKYSNFQGSDNNIITTIPIEEVTLRALSAEYEQDIFYDENGHFKDMETKEYLTSGVFKEKVLGLYCVSYEKTVNNVDGEGKTSLLKEKHFWAVKGSDVVETWQRLNDGVWKYRYDKMMRIDKIFNSEKGDCYSDVYKPYRKQLRKEYGEKVKC